MQFILSCLKGMSSRRRYLTVLAVSSEGVDFRFQHQVDLKKYMAVKLTSQKAPALAAILDQIRQNVQFPDLVAEISGPRKGIHLMLLDILPVKRLDNQTSCGIVKYLGTPVEEGDAIRWPMPHVTQILLGSKQAITPNELLDMIQKRYRSVSPRDGVEMRVPTPLKMLKIATKGFHMDLLTLMHIRIAMPDVKLSWKYWQVGLSRAFI